MSPFEELTALRAVLTVQEIAEMTGMGREALSRARADSRFQRRTQRVLDDLYAVVTRLRPEIGGDPDHLAAILRRPQPNLGRRSIAELLQDGKIDEVLEHLPPLSSPKARDHGPSRPGESRQGAAAAFLAGDPELAALLPEIEAKVREHFGPEVRIERAVIEDFESGEDDDFYLRARNGLSVEENVFRLRALLEREHTLLEPVHDRLTIGFL